jgi:hypothetical protein
MSETPRLADRWAADRCHLCGMVGGHHPHCAANPKNASAVAAREEVRMTESFKMFAMVTNQGTAMSETALCSEHYVDPYIGFARATGEGADDIGEDRTFHDCTDNDELACVECGASTLEQEWLVTFTKQVTACTFDEAIERADDGKGGGNWEAVPADKPVVVADGVSYYLWNNGYSVGYKAVNEAGVVEYTYLNASSGSDDGVATAFIYQGPSGEAGMDEPLSHVTVHDTRDFD